jgi:hypothetical protein
MPDIDKIVPELEELIGCRIRTHYNTGGVVKSYHGPHEMNGITSDGKRMASIAAELSGRTDWKPLECFTIVYVHERDGGRCWINSITIENGQLMCEGIPLTIMEYVNPTQMRLF